MHNYIVLDLEATCDKDRRIENEIIEIGAVKVNERGEIVDTFNMFVKPILNPQLTDFCKELTHISQEDVDNAPYFNEVIMDFITWLGSDYYLCSWGFYDKKQFEKDCLLHKVNRNWIKNHISLKHQYSQIKQMKKFLGLGTALKKEKIEFEGTPHRGIDDAKNIAKIFIKYLDKWELPNKL